MWFILGNDDMISKYIFLAARASERAFVSVAGYQRIVALIGLVEVGAYDIDRAPVRHASGRF